MRTPALAPNPRCNQFHALRPGKFLLIFVTQWTPVPVLPMALSGLRSGMSSRKGERASLSGPRPFSLVKLVVDAPLPAPTLAPEALQEITKQFRGSSP